ncbi:MAG: N-acetylneuraminate synthase family protein [Epsilonproteobacteria bacterium]|nr:N-acetylneuraminate synthase family protein [Campylobacterota bacterium]
MTIDKNITPYIIYYEDSIILALQKISDNKSGLVFTINERGSIEGILTDGDIRRWIVSEQNIDLSRKVSVIAKKDFVMCRISDTNEYISKKFDPKKNIKIIPLVDENNHFVAIAKYESETFEIAGRKIGDEYPSYIIAEIGNNHNGDINLAKKLVDLAVEAKVDCVKFQMRSLDSLYKNKGSTKDISEDLGSQYVLDLLSKFQLKDEELFEVFDYCKNKGTTPLCTPWDLESLAKLEQYGMQAYKVASADLTNHELLLALATTRKPLILSTGMSREEEVIQTVELLQKEGANFALLHCNSAYPAPFKDVHLNYLERLKEIGNCIIGYSGHERGIAVPIAAVAKGAKIIEKHFTVDKNMEGNDHKVSLLPEELSQMVQGIREVEEALGQKTKIMSQGELMNRENLAKSLVAKRAIKQGETITTEMLEVKSPGKGLQPNRKNDLVGKIAKRDFNQGDLFFISDIEDKNIEPRNYTFSRPWGVPVRYHDFREMLKKTNLELLEFHLSYKDLDEDIDSFFKEGEIINTRLVVHAPELFAGDHTLDLCAKDENYRKHSIQELNRVTEATRKLQKYFKQTNTPIVTNVGGFNTKGFIPSKERLKLYDLINESLKEVDTADVQIIPQTMPPFPWHFGGQSFHNLFVDPDEIVEYCEKHKMKICFDISHSQLACNYYKWTMEEFIEKIAPFVEHMHIADARGDDGEGLQIGDGTMNFKHIMKLIDKKIDKSATFLPEIWQGHKNGGEGFWEALDKLEKASQ